MLTKCILLGLAVSASAFMTAPAGIAARRGLPAISTSRPLSLRGGSAVKMVDITPNVSFDTIAREWRCKWSADTDKAALVSAQNELAAIVDEVKKVKGVKSVQRVVCGGCLDFKVVTSLDVESFGAWEEGKFAPEEKFLEKIKAIPGITEVETQTYTLMPM